MTTPVKFEVLDDPKREARECDLVVCHLVKDLPVPRVAGAVIHHCRDCGDRIWVAPSSPEKPPKLCVWCAKKLIAADAEDVVIQMSTSTALSILGGRRR